MAAATLNEGLSDQKCCWDLGGVFLAITWFKFSLAFEEPRKVFLAFSENLMKTSNKVSFRFSPCYFNFCLGKTLVSVRVRVFDIASPNLIYYI